MKQLNLASKIFLNIFIIIFGITSVGGDIALANAGAITAFLGQTSQVIINDGNKLVFQSYNSMIIEYDKTNNTITFGKDWDYSRTTGKYRNEFLRMYFPSLADGKKLKALEQVARANDGQIDMQIGAFIYTIKFE